MYACLRVTEELNARQVQLATAAGQLPDAHPTLRTTSNRNASRVLKADASRIRLSEPTYIDITCRTSKHDETPVMERVAFCPPAAMAAKVLQIRHAAALFGRSGSLEFWQQFKRAHPGHVMWQDVDAASLEYTFPYALHGDEGSGLCEVSHV